MYDHATYVTVNISSPNTKNLRDLQSSEALDALLTAVMGRRAALATRHGLTKPLLVKISPDLDDEQVGAIAELAVKHRVDGLIATNTTVARESVRGHRHELQAGGLSGRPLFKASTAILAASRALAGRAVIGVGASSGPAPRGSSNRREPGAALPRLPYPRATAHSRGSPCTRMMSGCRARPVC